MPPPKEYRYECIEPEFGDQLWRLELEDLDPELRLVLEAHAGSCHACALLLALDRQSQALAETGALARMQRKQAPTWLEKMRRASRPVAGLAFAASLLALLYMPPRSRHEDSVQRGDDHAVFLRPVEGELVSSLTPNLRWSQITGVSSYLVQVRELGGDIVWESEGGEAELRIPVEASLERDREYKVLLATQPHDLLPPEGISVIFRTGSIWAVALHRLRWAHPLIQTVGIVSIAIVLLVSLTRRGR